MANQERHGRRRDALVLALVFAAGVVLLLWAADWLARRAAESVLAGTVQQETGTSEPPSVDVHGTFFLPQVLRGRYDRVDIAAEGLVSGPLRIDSLDARLTDVHLSFADLLRGRTDRIVIGSSEERALLTYADLNRYLELTGRPFDIAPAEDGGLELTGTVEVLDQTLDASADARLSTEDGALLVEPTRVGAARELDRISRLLLGERFSFRVPLDPLPFGQRLTGVQVAPEGVRVDAAGTGVVLGT